MSNMLKRVLRLPDSVLNIGFKAHLSRSSEELRARTNSPTLNQMLNLGDFAERAITLRDAINNAVHIRCQNVADYYWSLPQESWDIRADFPNVSPSWPLAWFDWKQPSYLNKDGKTRTPQLDCGALLMAVKQIDKPISSVTYEEIGWTATWLSFIELPGKLGITQIEFHISKAGLCIPTVKTREGDRMEATVVWPRGLNDTSAQTIGLTAMTNLNVPLLALTFANCVNTKVLKDVEHSGFRERRKPRDISERPRTDWHLLQIGGTTRLIEREAESRGLTGIKQRLSIARGHFKHYEEGKGLFGKHPGTYWWNMHSRGDRKRGVVKKDYSVAPTE